MNKTGKRVIIVGAGFGGLYAAKNLLKLDGNINITLIDKKNYHLFQPLLYQVATAQLSPEDIAYPVREIFKNVSNITVLKENVNSIDLDKKIVYLECGELHYDKLIISVGVKPDYFGNDRWLQYAPSLKTLEDALLIRRKILNVFERAESEKLHPCEPTPLNFVIIGGGPTGIELAGALAELSKYSLKNEFRNINPERAKIYIIEAGKNILPGFSENLIESAEKSLRKLGVIVKTNSLVTEIENTKLTIKSDGVEEYLESKVILWAAGVNAKFTNQLISSAENIEYDNKGRVKVNNDLTIPGYADVYAIGDFATLTDENGKPLPGTAPVAIQHGIYVAKHITEKINSPFKYNDKGSLAVIGRNAAVAKFKNFEFGGFLAWILWVFVHIGYLIGFNNKLLVLIKWAWNYLIRKSTARIIYKLKG